MFTLLNRDDTTHGETYYLASEVDAVFSGPATATVARMKAAFEEKYRRDWDDPSGNEMKAIWSDAWSAASSPGSLVIGDHTVTG